VNHLVASFVPTRQLPAPELSDQELSDQEFPEQDFTEQELTALALSLPFDGVAAPDAVRFPTGLPEVDPLLPGWYMPPVVRGSSRLSHRLAALTATGAMLGINVAGLCITYGQVTLG